MINLLAGDRGIAMHCNEGTFARNKNCAPETSNEHAGKVLHKGKWGKGVIYGWCLGIAAARTDLWVVLRWWISYARTSSCPSQTDWHTGCMTHIFGPHFGAYSLCTLLVQFFGTDLLHIFLQQHFRSAWTNIFHFIFWSLSVTGDFDAFPYLMHKCRKIWFHNWREM